jgi:hypothetical protein
MTGDLILYVQSQIRVHGTLTNDNVIDLEDGFVEYYSVDYRG